jgi:hypothetical protein
MAKYFIIVASMQEQETGCEPPQGHILLHVVSLEAETQVLGDIARPIVTY